MIAPLPAPLYAVTSLALDLALGALAFACWPLDWELSDETLQVAVPIGLAGLLGAFLAGGYRLAYPRAPALARAVPAGVILGLAAGWLALKLVSSKAGLHLLYPPALEAFTPLVFALGLAAWLHRYPRLLALARREARQPVGLLALAAERPLLEQRLRARGLGAPLVTLEPTALAASEPLAALVLALPLSELTRPTLERLAEARARGLPLMSMARFQEQLFRLTPLDAPDDPGLILDEALARRSPLYLGAKRLLDVALALVLGALALIPIALLAVAVRLSSRGPAFFRQTRAGLHRRPFTLWKLRTMVDQAERDSGPTFAAAGDPRVTPLGRMLRRTRADELPQLWNILKGDMSLVGPRPERPEHDRELAPLIPFYALRHLVRPGLTGWAQVRVGYGASPADAKAKLEHDVYYLKHASFGFDLAILLRTIPTVLGLRGR